MLDYNLIPKKEINNKSGIYIITPYSSPSVPLNKMVLVKIGKAYNLLKRIDSYNSCMPESFWTYSVIRCSQSHYGKLEKLIHDALRQYIYKHPEYDARKKGEWFKLPKRVLRDTIRDILDEVDFRTYVFNIHPNNFKV